MSNKPIILAVDDDISLREIIDAALSDHYTVITRESGAAALDHVHSDKPEVILLDVQMPQLDGYETCRRLKQIDELADIPVLFVSGQERIEDRLRGYEAGGADYLVKPFIWEELQAKVAKLVDLSVQRRELKSMASFASSTAMTAMTEMSELGVVIGSIRKAQQCDDYQKLADTLIASSAEFGLNAAVQIRIPEFTVTRNSRGEATPLEASIIRHMLTVSRIVEFRTRLAINYEHVSLLINNLPVEEPERSGRLRDHLAIMVETADTRVQAIFDANESRSRGELLAQEKRKAALGQATQRITEALKAIDLAQRDGRVATQLAVNAMLEATDNALHQVALTVQQEDFLASIVRHGIEEIIHAQASSLDVQDQLSNIIAELKTMATNQQ